MSTTPQITEQSLRLFLALAADAGNWSGQPLFGGNVGREKADQGNLTQLKQAKLLTTDEDERGDSWVCFTPAGLKLAAEHGIDLSLFYEKGEHWNVC